MTPCCKDTDHNGLPHTLICDEKCHRRNKTAPTKPTIDEPQCVYAGCSHPKGLCIGNCKRIMEAKRPEPVAWLVQYRDRHEFTFKKPAFLIDAVAEPLYGPDLLAYADRMRTYWQAIDNRMVVLHLGTADSFDADTCMNKILEWETQIALDPSVSRQAEELRDTHKERAETAERQLAELQAKHDALVKALFLCENALCQQGLQGTYPEIIAKARAAAILRMELP